MSGSETRTSMVSSMAVYLLLNYLLFFSLLITAWQLFRHPDKMLQSITQIQAFVWEKYACKMMTWFFTNFINEGNLNKTWKINKFDCKTVNFINLYKTSFIFFSEKKFSNEQKYILFFNIANLRPKLQKIVSKIE
mgnify:CR=1 FL=1